jgi:hypothetical protein
MPDVFDRHSPSLTSPLIGGFVVSPNDNADLPQMTRQIRICGAGGTMAVVWQDKDDNGNNIETIEPVQTGDVWDWRITRIKATDTTATGIRGYY